MCMRAASGQPRACRRCDRLRDGPDLPVGRRACRPPPALLHRHPDCFASAQPRPARQAHRPWTAGGGGGGDWEPRPSVLGAAVADILGPNFSAPADAAAASGRSGADAAGGLTEAPCARDVLEWWREVRPKRRRPAAVAVARTRSRVGRSGPGRCNGKVESVAEAAVLSEAAASTPAHVPLVVEAAVATAVFDFGVCMPSSADAATLLAPRSRRRGGQSEGRRGARVSGGAAMAAAVAGGAERPWLPVQVTAAAAAGVLRALEAQECMHGVGEHTAGSGGAAVTRGPRGELWGCRGGCGGRRHSWRWHGRVLRWSGRSTTGLAACPGRWNWRGWLARSIPDGSAGFSGSLPWSSEGVLHMLLAWQDRTSGVSVAWQSCVVRVVCGQVAIGAPVFMICCIEWCLSQVLLYVCIKGFAGLGCWNAAPSEFYPWQRFRMWLTTGYLENREDDHRKTSRQVPQHVAPAFEDVYVRSMRYYEDGWTGISPNWLSI